MKVDESKAISYELNAVLDPQTRIAVACERIAAAAERIATAVVPIDESTGELLTLTRIDPQGIVAIVSGVANLLNANKEL